MTEKAESMEVQTYTREMLEKLSWATIAEIVKGQGLKAWRRHGKIPKAELIGTILSLDLRHEQREIGFAALPDPRSKP